MEQLAEQLGRGADHAILAGFANDIAQAHRNGNVYIIGVFAIFYSLLAAIYYLLPGPRLFVAKTAKEENAQLTKASQLVSLKKDSILEQNN